MEMNLHAHQDLIKFIILLTLIPQLSLKSV